MHYLKSDELTDDANFVMKESKSLNLVAGFVLMIVAAVILYNVLKDYHYDQVFIYKKMLFLTLFPGIFFIWRGLKSKVLLTINKNGIYRCGELLTTWDNFLNANITQDQITGSISDNFVLYIDFWVDAQNSYFRRKIKLPNTSDKSEEEILETIRYFCKFSKNYDHSAAIDQSQIVTESDKR